MVAEHSWTQRPVPNTQMARIEGNLCHATCSGLSCQRAAVAEAALRALPTRLWPWPGQCEGRRHPHPSESLRRLGETPGQTPSHGSTENTRLPAHSSRPFLAGNQDTQDTLRQSPQAAAPQRPTLPVPGVVKHVLKRVGVGVTRSRRTGCKARGPLASPVNLQD